MESILFILVIIIFLLLVLGAPYLIEKSMSASLLFRAKDAFDINYDKDTKILTFKTKHKGKDLEWKFKGNCTVWYWKCLYKGRCSTMYEYELNQIWEEVR